MITFEQATPADGQHQGPCEDCPLRRNAIPGWLGEDDDPKAWVQMLHGDTRMMCHAHLGAQCAGAAIYRRNVAKRPPGDQLILSADREAVFSSPFEFIEHHSHNVDPKFGQRCWAHHARGGVITGFAGKTYPFPGYGTFRYIAQTLEDAKAGRGMSFCDAHVVLGDPPPSQKIL